MSAKIVYIAILALLSLGIFRPAELAHAQVYGDYPACYDPYYGYAPCPYDYDYPYGGGPFFGFGFDFDFDHGHHFDHHDRDSGHFGHGGMGHHR